MTLPLAREFAAFGIRVMSIAPGIFHTPMVDGMTPEDAAAAILKTLEERGLVPGIRAEADTTPSA